MFLLSKSDCVRSGGLAIRHVVRICFISFSPAFGRVCFYLSACLRVFGSICHMLADAFRVQKRLSDSRSWSDRWLGAAWSGCWEANLRLASLRAARALNCRGIFPTQVFTFFRLPIVLTLYCYSDVWGRYIYIWKQKSVQSLRGSAVWHLGQLVSSLPLRVCHAMSGDGWQMAMVGR